MHTQSGNSSQRPCRSFSRWSGAHRPLNVFVFLCSLIHTLRSLFEGMDAGVSISTAAGGDDPEAGATSAPKAERSKPRSFTSMPREVRRLKDRARTKASFGVVGDRRKRGSRQRLLFAVSLLNRPPLSSSSSASVRERKVLRSLCDDSFALSLGCIVVEVVCGPHVAPAFLGSTAIPDARNHSTACLRSC